MQQAALTTRHVTNKTSTAALMDVLQALTGAGLVLFMWSHMVLVSSILVGPETMRTLAEFFEAS